MVIDGDNLYYVDGADAFMNCTSNWTINRVGKNGGAVTTMVRSPIDCPGSLVVDNAFLYWANTGNNSGLAGSLHRVPK
jgi:hypothetical protein